MRKGIRWLINDLNELYKEDNLNFELHIFGRIFKEEINILLKKKTHKASFFICII